jgi:predicted metalloprotease
MRGGQGLWCVGLVAVAVALSGCGDDPTPDPTETGGSTATPSPTETAPAVDELAIEPENAASTSDPLGEIIKRAKESTRQRETKVLDDATALGPLLNDFWTAELENVYGLQFDPPDRVEYYRGSENSACGGEPRPRPRNAYYCRPDTDEYVAFDLDWFQEYLADHPGGATTFLILAHEWGHAVQDTWIEQQPGKDSWDPAYTQELNADCLAGVFLAASIKKGTIVEDEGDAEDIFGWLYEGGTAPWLSRGDHGTADERQTAFAHGYTKGTDYCRTNY